MKTQCPCCHGHVDSDLPIADLNTNTLAFGNLTERVTPQQAELASVVIERFPGTASYDHIIRRMWGVAEPEKPQIILKTQLCSLRRIMRKLGFDIVTVPTYGMRLEKAK